MTTTCAKCGEGLIAPDWPQFVSEGLVVNLWICTKCGHRFETKARASPSIMLRCGDVVKSIVDAAIEYDVDLIGMPTAGRHGVLDALRGSTTQRVVRHAPCPVFAVPTPLTPD
jgi:Universal stress protein family